MKFNRSELSLIAFIAVLVIIAGCAGAAWYLSHAAVSTGQFESAIPAIDALLKVTVAGLLFSAGVASLWIFPMVRRESQARDRLEEKSENLRTAALTDPLTGLQNRRYFDDALIEYMREFKAIEKPLGAMIVDLDHFKNINDTYGHDNGDVVLRAVSICLQQHTRHHDVLARMGGEEFAIVFPNVDERSLRIMAERIRMAIENIQLVISGERIKVTASIGATLWDGNEDVAGLYKRADKYLYHAKHTGRNRVCMGMSDNAPKAAPVAVATEEPTAPAGGRRVMFGS